MARAAAKKLKSNKKYTDAPRFKAIYGYEDNFKKQFSNTLKVATKEITSKIKEIGSNSKVNSSKK